MNILEELTGVLSCATDSVTLETGKFSVKPPDEFIVLVPLSDSFGYHADDTPHWNIEEARVSIYTKGSYLALKNKVVKALINAGFTITDRRYIGLETDTGYHHYAVDAEKNYELEE
ncbi:MAG: hypothetical protein LUD50_04505 [Clostridia bacterium]|nr:hypothetical protein [Clostridia bacterium]